LKREAVVLDTTFLAAGDVKAGRTDRLTDHGEGKSDKKEIKT
jgi:hypothetical protein